MLANLSRFEVIAIPANICMDSLEDRLQPRHRNRMPRETRHQIGSLAPAMTSHLCLEMKPCMVLDVNENIDTTIPPVRDPQVRRQARKAVILYGLARLGLFVALTAAIQITAGVIGAFVPIFISAMLALLVAMPLSMLVFQNLRKQAVTAVALWDAQRKAYKQWVATELSNR